jgi:ABC-2 type transport system permease protein
MSDVGLAFAQGKYNLQKFLRNPRTMIFNVAMPVGLLLLFASVFGDKYSTTSFDGQKVNLDAYYTAGIAAYSVMLTAFSGLLIEIVGAREAGRLKRFRGTPMPPWVFFAAQALYIVVVALVMVGVLTAVGVFGFDVKLRAEAIPALIFYVVLGVFTFTTLAIALSRWIASPDLASSVGPFSVVGLGFISGVFITVEQLPAFLEDLGRCFPLAPLASGMQEVFTKTSGSGFRAESVAVLLAWGVVSLFVAVRSFSWQPEGAAA